MKFEIKNIVLIRYYLSKSSEKRKEKAVVIKLAI